MSQTTTSPRSPEVLMCILSYLGIFALVPYFIRKNDEFIHWHARQGLVLAAAMIGLTVVLAVISMLPAIGFVASLVSTVVGLASLCLSIYCMIQACSGKRWAIPVISALVK